MTIVLHYNASCYLTVAIRMENGQKKWGYIYPHFLRYDVSRALFNVAGKANC